MLHVHIGPLGHARRGKRGVVERAGGSSALQNEEPKGSATRQRPPTRPAACASVWPVQVTRAGALLAPCELRGGDPGMAGTPVSRADTTVSAWVRLMRAELTSGAAACSGPAREATLRTLRAAGSRVSCFSRLPALRILREAAWAYGAQARTRGVYQKESHCIPPFPRFRPLRGPSCFLQEAFSRRRRRG